MPKVIVVYASAGAGHFKAAQAIYNHLKEYPAGLEPEILDILDKTNPLFKFSYSNGYAFLIRQLPSIWRLGFWFTFNRFTRPLARAIGVFLNALNTAGFSEYLIGSNPDYVVSTHFLSSEISARLKREGRIKSKIISVITDFGVHPFWINRGTDLYISACDLTRQQLLREGVGENLIKVSGIPVGDKFLKKTDKDALLSKLNLEKNKFTVLIITGSFGIGPIKKTVAALCGQVQLLVVCARNNALFANLTRKNYPGVRVFGFIDNIEELMGVSDLIITKPGGLGISESLVMELFPLYIAPIPGHEEENIKILSEYGVGMKVNSVCDIKNAVIDFRGHPEKLMAAKELIRKIRKPYAAKDVCDAIR